MFNNKSAVSLTAAVGTPFSSPEPLGLIVEHVTKKRRALGDENAITRTFKGNRKKFELSRVRVIGGNSKQIAGSKGKTSFT